MFPNVLPVHSNVSVPSRGEWGFLRSRKTTLGAWMTSFRPLAGWLGVLTGTIMASTLLYDFVSVPSRGDWGFLQTAAIKLNALF